MLEPAIAWIEANADLLGGIGTISAATMFLVTNGRNMMQRVAPGGIAAPGAGTASLEGPIADAPPPSPEYGNRTAIAILPFKEMGDLPEHFAAGLMDDLMADLQKQGFAAPASERVAKLLADGADSHRIVRDLGTTYVLEGSIRRQEDKFRISVQLIDATAAVKWSDRINMVGDDVMAMQEAIAAKISGAIDAVLSPDIPAADTTDSAPTPYRTQSEALAATTSPKSRLIALVMCVIFGALGVHRFYVGRWITGILYIFTGGLFVIGWFIDILLLLFGGLTDRRNRRIRNWLPAEGPVK